MNKLKFLKNQLSIIVVYMITILSLALVLFLQNKSSYLMWLVLRITWLPVLIIILYRIYHEALIVKKIKQDQPVHQTDSLNQTYQRELSKQKQRANQAEIKAKKNERSLIDYLITWSHEMKLPIAALSLLAEQNDKINSDQIFKQVSLMKNQLDNLLTYERLNDFNHDLDFGWILLSEIINDTIKEYSTFFIEKKIIPQTDNLNFKLLTDEKWMKFVIKQIVYNALKYADDGTALQIYFKQNQLVIEDYGLPISASDLPRIFEPGFTGSNGRAKQSATGMGLYLVKRICDELNVDIKITSKQQLTKATLIFPNSNIKK